MYIAVRPATSRRFCRSGNIVACSALHQFFRTFLHTVPQRQMCFCSGSKLICARSRGLGRLASPILLFVTEHSAIRYSSDVNSSTRCKILVPNLSETFEWSQPMIMKLSFVWWNVNLPFSCQFVK